MITKKHGIKIYQRSKSKSNVKRKSNHIFPMNRSKAIAFFFNDFIEADKPHPATPPFDHKS